MRLPLLFGLALLAAPAAAGDPCKKLIKAISKGELEQVKAELAEAGDLKACKAPPLIHAVAINNPSPQVVEALLAAGAPVEREQEHLIKLASLSPAKAAAVLPTLLDSRVGDGFNWGLAFFGTADGERFELFASACEKRLKAGRDCPGAAMAFPVLAVNDFFFERISRLAEIGLDVKGADGGSALHNAVALGYSKTALFLLERGADPNAVSQNSFVKNERLKEFLAYVKTTPLMAAAANGDAEWVERLLAKGAKVNHRERDMTALGIAAAAKDRSLAKLLISKGADVEDALDGLQACVNRFEQYKNKTWEVAREGAEFLEKLARPPTAAAPAGGGVSKDELASLVKAAVKDAAAPAKAEAPAAAASDVDKPAYGTAESGDKVAVVVGIEKYPSLPAAAFAERDAQAVRAHLQALGFAPRNIAFLAGADATRAGLVKTLNSWLPNRVTEKSTVFFYFSGHGAPDVRSSLAYLVPADGDPEYLEDTAYPLKQLYSRLNGLKAKEIVVALDACFSGAGGRSVLPKGARPLVSTVDLGGQSAGRVVVFSASKGEQISGTIEEQGHGAFTYYFLKGLNGAAADASGAVTAQALHAYLAPKVEDAARLRNRGQNPQLWAGGNAGLRLK